MPMQAIPAPMAPPAGVHDAADLQRALNALGADPPVAVDDSYGRETRRAVEAFQKAAGLEADGLAGPETWLAINAKLKQAAR
jgi:peptidoglycan hydrolase-like protein with peptidoglycan-binding domain